MKPGSVLPISITCVLLSALAACGGGGGSSSPPVASPAPPATPGNPPPTGPAIPALAQTYTAISSAAVTSQRNWPAWNQAGSAVIGGIGCARNENYHVHTLLSIYRNGVRLASPDSIGRGGGCTYELHTHDGAGVIHVETDVPKTFTLGQWFTLWGQPLGTDAVAGLAGPVSYYVIENETITRYTGNPADIVLAGRKEIVIITGAPPAELPRYNWASSGL